MMKQIMHKNCHVYKNKIGYHETKCSQSFSKLSLANYYVQVRHSPSTLKKATRLLHYFKTRKY